MSPPDGTDVSGHLEPLAEAQTMFSAAYTSVLPTAIAHDVLASSTPTRRCPNSRATPSASHPDRPCASADRRMEAKELAAGISGDQFALMRVNLRRP